MILYGAGGHAKVVRDSIATMGKNISVIFDDNQNIKMLDYTTVQNDYNTAFNSNEPLVISIGNNLTRKVISEKIKHPFGTVIHASALISSYTQIDKGSVILHGTIIQAGAKIGKHCIVNSGAIIEHNCIVQDQVLYNLASGWSRY